VTIDDLKRATTFASYVPRAVLRRVAMEHEPPSAPAIAASGAALLLVDITGFTGLTASAVARGPAGTEALWAAINEYLGQMVDVAISHGGDIAKIVGDALIPVWPAVDGDVADATLRAAICASRLAAELGELEVEEGLRLSIKIGLGAGAMTELHLGGRDGRWLYMIAGDAVGQLTRLGPRMRTGEVVASPEAWAYLRHEVEGRPLEDGHVLVQAAGLPALATAPPDLADVTDAGEMVRSYIPRVSEARIDAGQGAWLAEIRRTSVAFVGIRGLGSAEADTLEAFERVSQVGQDVLARFDGWLKELTMDDKGTTLVAVFGVPPHSHEDDPSRAIEAAQALADEIGRLGLPARAGVATGPAVCGPVGNERRRDFAVLGGHVNLAARLAQEAEDGVVLSDAETHEATRGRRTFERLAAYVLKGLATPIDVYRLSAAAGPGRVGIIGRRDELAAADRAVLALASGTGGLHVVEGEPGIGKSTFVRAWAARAETTGARSLTGVASQIEGSTSYHAWRPIVESLLGIDGLADRERRRVRAIETLSADPEALRMAPLLDQVLPLDIPDDAETTQLVGEVRADNTRDLLIRLIGLAARRQPHMLVIEDAHWLDSASWSLASRAAREIPPLLLVLTTRPGGADEQLADVANLATTIRLGPLSREEALALACERTGASGITESVAAIVESRAEGNPLFVEQLTFAMRDAGRIVVQDGTVRPAAGDQLDSSIIPDTIQRVLTTRMDQLPPGEALTLKVASVVGERFGLEPLLRVYPVAIEEADLRRHLETLIRLGLVSPGVAGDEERFEFRHVIAREVAYNLMLSSQARELHHALAQWYETTFAPDLMPYHALLAHHWRRAGDAARAVDHLERAAAGSLGTFANEEAIAAFEEAIELASEAGLQIAPKRKGRWHLGLGEAHVHLSRYRDGRGHLELGLRLLGQPAPRSQAGQATGVFRELARQALRRVGLGRAYRLDERSGADLVSALRAYERLAEASFLGGETILPLYCVVRVLNEAEKSGIPAEIARGYAGSGALFGVVPAPRIAQWYLDRSMARLTEVDDLTTHEIVELVVGFCGAGVGHWDAAQERFRSVSRIARRLGDRRRLDDAMANLMELHNLHGAFGEAADTARQLIASASARRDRRFETDGLVGLGYASWHRGDRAEASRALERARLLLDEQAEVPEELRIRALGLAAIESLDRGDRTAAIAASEELVTLTDARPTNFGTFSGCASPAEVYLALWESDHPLPELPGRAAQAVARVRGYGAVFPIGRPRAATLEGRRRWLAGDRAGAVRSWQHAVDLATDLAMDYEQGLAHFELGRHEEPGSADRATHLTAAINLFERLEAGRALQSAAAAAGTTGSGSGRGH
jgi:class 3 adenylate cyclase/tetratricopeptide (TPR) repeat protein